MPKTYRPYDYNYDTAYVGRTRLIENYLDKKFANISIDKNEIKDTIETTIENSIGDIDCKFCSVHNHIERAKTEILNGDKVCTCNLATKEDVTNAVTQINSHVDEKFNEVDFLKQFSDLNQQIAEIKNN